VTNTGSDLDSHPRLAVREMLTNLRRSCSAIDIQTRAVAAVALSARCWLADRASPGENSSPFPIEMVWMSLAPLLESLNEENCWRLIASEDLRGAIGPDVVGHIIASNTPLLAITSVVRALLIGSASVVKLPARQQNGWFDIFWEYLAFADAEISQLIEVGSWPRISAVMNEAFYKYVDLLLVYGDDLTIDAIVKDAGKPVVGYGHKISAAIIGSGNINDQLLEGLALDVLMYDQGGCLSPHTIFVEGDQVRCRQIARRFATALEKTRLPSVSNTSVRAAKLAETRSLIRMDENSEIIMEGGERFTVVTNTKCNLQSSSGCAVIYVVPGSKEGIIQVLRRNNKLIQGLALACHSVTQYADWISHVQAAGINYICPPGALQKPSIEWRENDLDVLRSIVNSISS
jgi:hypothetical protein